MTRFTTSLLLATLLAVAAEAPAAAQGAAPAPGAPPAVEGSDTGVVNRTVEADAGLPDDVTPVAPVTAAPRVAYAGPPSLAPERELPVPAAPATAIEAYVARDASTRAFASGTALTNRRGTVTVQAWAPTVPLVGAAAIGYAVTDRLELAISAAAVPAWDVAIGAVSVKYQVVRRARGALAVQAFHVFANQDADELLTGGSLIGSHCLDRGCDVLGTLHLGGFPTPHQGTGTAGTALNVVGGGSLVAGRKAKLVLDVAAFGVDDDPTLGVYAGVRYASPRLSVDLGLAGGAVGDDAAVIPVPLVGLSGRW